MKNIDKILHEALIKNNVLTDADLRIHTMNADAAGKSLQQFLLENEIITEQQILVSLSQTLSLPTIDLSNITIETSVIERVPIKIAWYYQFMPVKVEGKVINVATAAPLDLKTQDEIRTYLGLLVNVSLTTQKDLQEAIKKYYGFASDTIDKIMTKDPQKMDARAEQGEQWVEDLETQPEDPTVSHLVNQIILEAYRKRATDIHIEPYRNKVRFRYRIDGVLIDANLPDKAKHFLPAMLSRIKILANLSITEKRLPQDGSAVVKTKDQHLDLRVSTMPTPRGESMVLRILPAKVMLFSLEKLGFDAESVAQFRYLITKPHGIIFMTGPTGSGKTTTLYACLNEINSMTRKIITIEDPVEYEMEGITQVQVNPKVNFSFSTGLRSLLRHDPDIIMVGEVRDLETAEIAIRTALTGHLVFSTLHTNDASSGITRLVDMGVEPYLVASSVEAFVAQRLVRIICPKCKKEDKAPLPIKEEMARSLKLKDIEQVKIYRGSGCDYCNNTGFYGRVAIYEILILNDTIRAAILEKQRSDYIKGIALREGLVTLRQNGWRAVLKGLTTPEEVLNITVKDDYELGETAGFTETGESTQKTLLLPKGFRFIKVKKKDAGLHSGDYESRIYPRTFEPVEIRYRLTKRDPGNPKGLIAEGVEYTSLTEDLSAGGLRLISKILISVGSILEVKISLGEGQKNIVCLAKVCRVEEDSLENVYTIVTYFLDISSADRATIAKFVGPKGNEQSLEEQQKTVNIAKE